MARKNTFKISWNAFAPSTDYDKFVILIITPISSINDTLDIESNGSDIMGKDILDIFLFPNANHLYMGPNIFGKSNMARLQLLFLENFSGTSGKGTLSWVNFRKAASANLMPQLMLLLN